ncbi:MAG: tetratricopeptide repeat protein [Rhodospirillales bacterium]|nr:tetratricopeptide repeat protein [Rhodospirillales bacterium]
MRRRSHSGAAGTAGGSPSSLREVGRLLADGVRFHRQGQIDRAADIYRRVLKLDPRQSDALHLLGLVAHRRGELLEARRAIEQAIALNPRQATYANSLGVIFLDEDRPDEAERLFRDAIDLDPMYPEALNNLGNALLRQGHLEPAIVAYDRAIAAMPAYAEAWCNRGRALHLQDRPAEAVESFRRALAIRPDWTKALRYLADALGAQGERQDAETALRRAIAIDGADPASHAALAALLERENRLEEALAAAQEALARDSGDVRAVVTAARVERRLGRPDDGLRRLDALGSGERAAISPLDAETWAYAAFERGQILDRLKDYSRAYPAFVAANGLLARVAAARNIDRTIFPQMIERLRRKFSPLWVASWAAAPRTEQPEPIFLVGFPRSGTTLLDQILDSHPALSTMEEKDAIDQVRRVIERRPDGYPDAMATFSSKDITRLRNRYFSEVAQHVGNLGQRRLVDKMPLNTIDVGLIHRLFPHAPILLALRHPCDVVLSGFMQAMQPNAAMVLFDSLDSTARFYALTMDLWLHYRTVLPLTVITVRYEDLVADFRAETFRILDSLGLPWDDAVLNYAQHAQGRTIATPSYSQVVQPIYTRSIDRWRNYADAFAGVLPILQPYIDAFGYSS